MKRWFRRGFRRGHSPARASVVDHDCGDGAQSDAGEGEVADADDQGDGGGELVDGVGEVVSRTNVHGEDDIEVRLAWSDVPGATPHPDPMNI
ncbi:hypothetical protein ACIA03_00580 [Nocardioides sp. NPDC051685]|uniref:hypothetical protein n=1 Tax=Nocardioides sp. NPDC051685 TaxID=3364334 RepID=UPI0037B0EA34